MFLKDDTWNEVVNRRRIWYLIIEIHKYNVLYLVSPFFLSFFRAQSLGINSLAGPIRHPDVCSEGFFFDRILEQYPLRPGACERVNLVRNFTTRVLRTGSKSIITIYEK